MAWCSDRRTLVGCERRQLRGGTGMCCRRAAGASGGCDLRHDPKAHASESAAGYTGLRGFSVEARTLSIPGTTSRGRSRLFPLTGMEAGREQAAEVPGDSPLRAPTRSAIESTPQQAPTQWLAARPFVLSTLGTAGRLPLTGQRFGRFAAVRHSSVVLTALNISPHPSVLVSLPRPSPS